MNPLIQPRWLLHAEGAVLLAASVVAFSRLSGNWLLFAALILAPDVSTIGYWVNPRVGAACYNSVHTELGPAALLTIGLFTSTPLLVTVALIWFAHIGIDRLAGFGLKYPTKFPDTHLQHV
jgi:hypothetical protein